MVSATIPSPPEQFDRLPAASPAPERKKENAMSDHVTEHRRGGLGELRATAICGNDITSSCLYVSALAIIQAGKWDLALASDRGGCSLPLPQDLRGKS